MLILLGLIVIGLYLDFKIAQDDLLEIFNLEGVK
jgi:hypothetical protein